MAGDIVRLGKRKAREEPADQRKIGNYTRAGKPFKRRELDLEKPVPIVSNVRIDPPLEIPASSSSSEDEIPYDPGLGTKDAGKSVRVLGRGEKNAVVSNKTMNTGPDRPKVFIRNQYEFYVPLWVYENRYNNRYKNLSEGNYAGIKHNGDNHFNDDPNRLERLSLTRDEKSYQRMGFRGLTVPTVLVEIKHESLKFRQLVDAEKEKGRYLTGQTGISEIFVIEPYGRYSNLEKRLLEPDWQLPKEAQPILSRHQELMERIKIWQDAARGAPSKSDRSDRGSDGRG